MQTVFQQCKYYLTDDAQKTMLLQNVMKKLTITERCVSFCGFSLCLRLTFCSSVITRPSGTNSALVCWFCVVLFQWFFPSGRMSALCAWPSLRTLDVILSTWSLRYLLSSTMLPSRCSATWNAWLASSLKPSWNCVFKCCSLRLRSPPSSHVCRSQKKISPLEGRCSLKQKTHKTSFRRLPPLSEHLFDLLICWSFFFLHIT